MSDNIIAERRRMLRMQITKLTYPLDWSEDPETIKKVRELIAELEKIGRKAKKAKELRDLNFENLDADKYVTLRQYGYEDRELCKELGISMQRLIDWKKSAGLTRSEMNRRLAK